MYNMAIIVDKAKCKHNCKVTDCNDTHCFIQAKYAMFYVRFNKSFFETSPNQATNLLVLKTHHENAQFGAVFKITNVNNKSETIKLFIFFDLCFYCGSVRLRLFHYVSLRSSVIIA